MCSEDTTSTGAIAYDPVAHAIILSDSLWMIMSFFRSKPNFFHTMFLGDESGFGIYQI
jgi:hypothetical protein